MVAGGVSAEAEVASGTTNAPATTTAARAARPRRPAGLIPDDVLRDGRGRGPEDDDTNEDATENGSEGEDEGGEGHRGRQHAQSQGEQPDADRDVEAPHDEDGPLVPAGDGQAGERLHRRRGGRERGPPDDGDDVDVDLAADDDRCDDLCQERDAGTDDDSVVAAMATLARRARRRRTPSVRFRSRA